MTLEEILEPINKIEDDEEFIETEHEAVREFYYEHKGKISEDDRDLLVTRGFDEWMDEWDYNVEKERED